MLLFYCLVLRITVDKVFCRLVCYLQHTYSPAAWAEWRFEACLYLFISDFSISFLRNNSLCLGFTESFQLPWIHRAKTFRIQIEILPKYLLKKTKCLLHGKMMVRCCFAEQQMWLWHWCLLVKDWNPNSMIHSHYSYWPVDSHWFTV